MLKILFVQRCHLFWEIKMVWSLDGFFNHLEYLSFETLRQEWILSRVIFSPP